MPNGVTDLELFVGSLEERGITFDVVDEGLPDHVEASCVPEDRTIYLSAATYEGVIRNDDRARFTIFHELGHMLLAHSRSFHRELSGNFHLYENSEWQADQFAAEILMPLEVIRAKNFSAAWELRNEFGVSHSAASTRLAHLRSRREIKNA
jgi:hypothetical protein